MASPPRHGRAESARPDQGQPPSEAVAPSDGPAPTRLRRANWHCCTTAAGRGPGTADRPLQWPQSLPPEQHRSTPEASGGYDHQVIDQAAQAGAVLQQASSPSTTASTRPMAATTACSERRSTRRASGQSWPRACRSWAVIHSRQPEGRSQQHGEQGVITEVVFAVITAEQQRPSGTINH